MTLPNVSIERTQFYNSCFNAYIQGDNIIQADFYGNSTAVGITNQKAQQLITENKELKELLDKYTNKLVELGVIQKEKTPEEIMQEQTALIQKMSESLTAMQNEIISLKEKKDDRNTGSAELVSNVSTEHSEQPRRKTATVAARRTDE